MWQITKGNESYCELMGDESDPFWKAIVSHAGCIEIIKYYNERFDEKGTLHICDLNDFILRLQLLKNRLQYHFQNDFPEGHKDTTYIK